MMQPKLAEIAAEIVDTQRVIGFGGDCPTCGWLYGFHDVVLHSYHDVPKQLTWKVGEPAPWEQPAFNPFGRGDRRINQITARDEQPLQQVPAPLTILVPVVIEEDEPGTLSVLKGLTADDLV